jgi:hypothetical protein
MIELSKKTFKRRSETIREPLKGKKFALLENCACICLWFKLCRKCMITTINFNIPRENIVTHAS